MSAALAYTDSSANAHALHVLERAQLAAWRATQSPAVNAWLDAQNFTASPGSLLALPGEHGVAGAVIGIGDALDPYAYAHAPFGLPAGDWKVATDLSADARVALQLGWGLGSYRFDRYKQPKRWTCWPPACRCATWSTRRPNTWARTSWKTRCARWPPRMARRSR